jgi:hypothetical protein
MRVEVTRQSAKGPAEKGLDHIQAESRQNPKTVGKNLCVKELYYLQAAGRTRSLDRQLL